MKLMDLLKEVLLQLKEVGNLDQVEPLPFKKINSDEYKSEYNDMTIDIKFSIVPEQDVMEDFELPDIFYDIFEKTEGDKKIYHSGYAINGDEGQFTKMTLKEFYPILKTVVVIIEQFMKQNKPFGLFIFGIDKGGELKADRQKNMFYYEISKRHLPSGYRMVLTKWKPSGETFDGFMIFRES